MTEDDILDRFECWELREKIAELEGKLKLAKASTPHNGKGIEVNAQVANAERRVAVAEARYEAALQRNVVLARKVKELGG